MRKFGFWFLMRATEHGAALNDVSDIPAPLCKQGKTTYLHPLEALLSPSAGPNTRGERLGGSHHSR